MVYIVHVYLETGVRGGLAVECSTTQCRGVQYVHWVMHKCIMVKVGGNEIHVKYVKSR